MTKKNKLVILICMGFFSSFISCFSDKNHTKKRAALQKKIAEITPEKFDILTFGGNANAGDMDFSKYKSRLKWLKDPKVEFSIKFQYKEGAILLTDESFNYSFNIAKNDIFDSYKLLDLCKAKFPNCKISSSRHLETEQRVFLFLEEEVRDANYEQLIDNLRWCARKSLQLLNRKSLDFKASFTEDLSIEDYKYNSITFEYTSKHILKKDSILFLQDNLKNTTSKNYRFKEFDPVISTHLKKRHEGIITLIKCTVKDDWERRKDAKLRKSIEWLSFSATIIDQIPGKELEKVNGEINIYTKEIKIDE